MSKKNVVKKDCLSCSHSMSGDADIPPPVEVGGILAAGFDKQILVCTECAGHEGIPVTVEEEFLCENYN